MRTVPYPPKGGDTGTGTFSLWVLIATLWVLSVLYASLIWSTRYSSVLIGTVLMGRGRVCRLPSSFPIRESPHNYPGSTQHPWWSWVVSE
jgi:hypothetical protein